MVALELVRQHWMWAMLLGGVLLTWWVYLAHYGAPEPDAGEGAEDAVGHEFPEGVRETDLPVPPALLLFFVWMALFAIGYVLWIRYGVGAF
ncbi:MAG: hypothetical protein HY321_21170 [Armatimonadetes bacterium]|nr:hypothetical protein [Armatimonadota bacterium]